MVCTRTLFASAAGCTVATALSMIKGSSTGLHIQPNLRCHDPRDVENVFDDLRQQRGVAFKCFDTACGLVPERMFPRSTVNPRDRVQGRAQFVRPDGEKFVLHPVRRLGDRRTTSRFRERRTPTLYLNREATKELEAECL
jgi:hypothetical protein